MRTSKIIRPVNSLIFISDQAGGDGPEWEKDKQVLSTNSCISVVCYPEQDGPTEVVLGAVKDVKSNLRLAFDGTLQVPSLVLTVQNVTHDVILAMSVADPAVRVRIWLNHPRWADKVLIGVG
jgi:hypothetical protein